MMIIFNLIPFNSIQFWILQNTYMTINNLHVGSVIIINNSLVKSIYTKYNLELFPLIFDNSNIHVKYVNTNKNMTSTFHITVIISYTIYKTYQTMGLNPIIGLSW